MNGLHFFLFLICVAASTTATSEENWHELHQTTLPLQVLLPGGPYHGDEIRYPAGPGWLALVVDGASARLQPVSLKIRWVYDAINDVAPKGPYTGKVIGTEPFVNAVIILKGGSLHPDQIPSAQIKGDSHGLTAKEFVLANKIYSLQVENDCGKVRNNCNWVLSDGKVEQTLYEFGVSNTPENTMDTDSGNTGIVWAGDLDRDGKLDLIVDVSNHFNSVAAIRVFLSTTAKNGQLVRTAGWFSSVGC